MANKIRTPQFAGRVYQADPNVLKLDVTELLALEPLPTIPDPNKLLLLKVPHIDYYRGHRSYGRGYQLLQNTSIDVIFLMGTSHQPGESLFIGTRDNYSSPLGVQQNADEIIEQIISKYGQRFLEEQSLHTHEHSLELQMPFITSLVPHAKLVPILVGDFHSFYKDNRAFIEPYEAFIEVMMEILEDLDKQKVRYAFIAGVDMSHIGQSFGDKERITKERIEQVKIFDEEYLNLIVQKDANKLFYHCAKDHNAQRVCGHSTMITICDILKKQKQENRYCLASYEQSFNQDEDCLVSFASLGLYKHKQ